MRARLGLAAVLTVGALFLLSPATSQAAGPKPKDRPAVTGATAPSQGVGTAPVTVDARCPSGKAVGGGFQTFPIGIDAGSGPTVALMPVILESRRLDPRTWRVTEQGVRNPQTPSWVPGTNLTVSVYCMRHLRVSEVIAAGAPSVASSTPSTANPICPAHKVAISGGFSLSPLSGTGFSYPSVYENLRSGNRSWRSSAVPGERPSVQLTGYAYCSKRAKPPRMRTWQVSSTPGAGPVRACSGGLAASAGGWLSSPGTTIVASEGTSGGKKRSYPPGTAYPAGQSWLVAPDHLGVSTTGFAYCS
jgi:hypothetical protein